MTLKTSRPRHAPWMVIVVLVGFTFAVSSAGARAAADTAETLYATALADERRLLEPGVQASLEALRAAAGSYETVVHRFPNSGFAEHALWQASGLAMHAYDLYRQMPDIETSVRLLESLDGDYPDGTFSARVAERRRQLDILPNIAWVRDIRREADDNLVRITIALDRQAAFDSYELADPAMVYVDIQQTHPSPPLRDATLHFDDAFLIPAVRTGRYPGHLTRVVLDTTGASDCRVHRIHEPFRILIECDDARAITNTNGSASNHDGADGQDRDTAAPDRVAMRAGADSARPTLARLEPLAAGSDAAASHATPSYTLAQQLGLGIGRVVIDPGHGGKDPGAHADALEEADIVLDIAMRLERRLAELSPPVDVILTRRDDRYVPLKERAELANRVGADLFVSIHANASDTPSARGVATYSLNLVTDADAGATASRENRPGLDTMTDLETFIEAIAVHSKIDESRALANLVQNAMVRSLRSADPNLPDLGVKEAPFVVLLGARMPGILTEVSFLTNAQDAALLATSDYRDQIAHALFEGIRGYRGSLHDPVGVISAGGGQ